MNAKTSGSFGEADQFICHELAPPLFRIVGDYPVLETRIRPGD
jgi:hypothetical protein